MLRRSVLLAVLLAVVALGSLSASAAVGVTLRVSALEPFTTQGVIAACPVTVPDGADGVVVLEAAQRSGCIDSYETQTFDFGRFVDCINGVCGTAATYWRMTENGRMTSYGVDGFEAAAGDVLGFSYTTWAGCLVGESLC